MTTNDHPLVQVLGDELVSGQFSVYITYWFRCLCKLLRQSVTAADKTRWKARRLLWIPLSRPFKTDWTRASDYAFQAPSDSISSSRGKGVSYRTRIWHRP
jgi:hypothetical protein